jgi:hypothetical protein
MPKSTPIAQIPTGTVIDSNDDDETVREVLRELSVHGSSNNTNEGSSQLEDMAPASSSPPQQTYDDHVSAHEPVGRAVSHHSNYANAAAAASAVVTAAPSSYNRQGSFYFAQDADEDVRLAAVAAAVYLLVQIVPIEQFVKSYVPALGRFSYADVLIKAATAAVLLYLLRRYQCPFPF